VCPHYSTRKAGKGCYKYTNFNVGGGGGAQRTRGRSLLWGLRKAKYTSSRFEPLVPEYKYRPYTDPKSIWTGSWARPGRNVCKVSAAEYRSCFWYNANTPIKQLEWRTHRGSWLWYVLPFVW
jgi:hypothetical protein